MDGFLALMQRKRTERPNDTLPYQETGGGGREATEAVHGNAANGPPGAVWPGALLPKSAGQSGLPALRELLWRRAVDQHASVLAGSRRRRDHVE